MDLSAVEKKIKYTFKNKELLKRALTLSSFDYRHSNESLEFFGDAILEFIVSEKIFGIDADSPKRVKRWYATNHSRRFPKN